MTLIELMIVIAIAAILAGLSAVGITQAKQVSGANADAEVIGQYVRNARMRALAQGCAHVMRFSGSTVPNSASAYPATVSIYRKANCRRLNVSTDWAVGTATQTPKFEAGDVWVSDAPISRQSVVKRGATDLAAVAILVAFTPDGRPVTYNDDGASVTNLGSTTSFSVSALSNPGYVLRSASLSDSGDVTFY